MDIIKQLETAKNNVKRLLEHSTGLVDMHGIVYRAERVEILRQEVAKL